MSHGNGEIIEVLRAARQAKQLSQRELSAKAGVPQSHIS
ncbi:helix-turn-helix transcriptional regulator, partial [Acinetobacter baumannii]